MGEDGSRLSHVFREVKHQAVPHPEKMKMAAVEAGFCKPIHFSPGRKAGDIG
jgi:hypothetical protein